MSYLDGPRINFSGMFQADVSTINNDVTNYDVAHFDPRRQQLGAEGSWNPEGTGSFRLIDCVIGGGSLDGRLLASAQDDPAIGMHLENADRRVSGKLVDLDPQQQMVSEIWGLQLRLSDGGDDAVFAGAYETAAFTNLWMRQLHRSAPNDQQLAAVYTSVLRGVTWRGHTGSALLDALRAASEDGTLSINMNVFGYGRDPSIPRYTLGHVVGSIGPQRPGSPRHFVVGRQMIPVMKPNSLSPDRGAAYLTCVVDEAARRVSADFGNALPIESADGGFADIGPLVLAVARDDPDARLDTVPAAALAVLGEIAYPHGDPLRSQQWFARSAGIVEMDYGAAGDWAVQHIGQRPLLLCKPDGAGAGRYRVVLQESIHGLYLRADQFVYRLNPGETAEVDLYCARFGKPCAASVACETNSGMMGPVPPPIGTGTVEYPAQLATGADGHALLPIHAPAAGPGNPRGYIDGQLYGVGYSLPAQPADSPQNMWNFISLLVFDRIEVPAQPTWHADIQPILQQYANLYPIMSRHLIDLDDYDSVTPHVRILEMAFSLPRDNPNHMPVTRDLSDAKREMILRWLRQPGPDGKPLKGVVPAAVPVPAATPVPAPQPALQLEPLQQAGKTSFVLAYQARQAKPEVQP